MKLKKYLYVIAMALVISLLGSNLSFVSGSTTNSTKAVKIPVLTYHHIAYNIDSSLVVTPEKYRQDMLIGVLASKRTFYTLSG